MGAIRPWQGRSSDKFCFGLEPAIEVSANEWILTLDD
jgi:hypothetical protein